MTRRRREPLARIPAPLVAWVQRALDAWALRGSARTRPGAGVNLIGLDVAQPPARLRTSSWAPAGVAVVVGGLFLVALRVDVTRLRYSLATAMEREQALLEDQRQLTVEMRKRRDPVELARVARASGFGRPERLIELTEPQRPRAPLPEPRAYEVLEIAARSRGPAS